MSRHLLLLFLILSGLSLLTSCKSEGGEETEHNEALVALEKEVIAVHDEVMPKMGRISELKTKLESEAKNPSLDSAMQIEVQLSIEALILGDSLMWDWMHNYEKPVNAPDDSVKTYLENEKIRIRKVSDSMLSAIKNAEDLLQKLGHGKPH